MFDVAKVILLHTYCILYGCTRTCPYLRSVLSLVADCYETRYFGLNGCYRLLNYDAGCLSAAELLAAFACLLYAKGGIPDVVTKIPVSSSFWSNFCFSQLLLYGTVATVHGTRSRVHVGYYTVILV